MARREIVAQGTYGMVRRGAIIKPTTVAKTEQAAPPANTVRLNSGEYVSTSEFNNLTIAQQAYLKKFGVGAFNREQAKAAQRKVEAIAPYKVGEGYDVVQMLQAGYSEGKLKGLGISGEAIANAQKYVIALRDIREYEIADGYDLTRAIMASDKGDILEESLVLLFGVKAVNDARKALLETPSGEELFSDMVKAGDIPKGAVFQSYSAATGELSYNVPETRSGEQLFGDMIKSGDIPKDAVYKDYDVQTGEMNYTVPTPKDDKGWFANTINYLKQALTVDETTLTGEIFGIKNPGLERAAAQINKVFEVFAPKVETKLDDPVGFFVETAKTVASYMPFVWVVNWKHMSTEEKIINGAIDAVIVMSLGLGMGLSKLKAKPLIKAATSAGKAAGRMNKTLKVLAKTPLDDIAKYTRASSNAQKAIQASKVADAKFITQLTKVGSLTSKQLKIIEKASGIRGLRKAIISVSKAQTELQKAWKPIVPKAKLQLGGARYIAQMAKVEKAQANLAKALATFDSKLKPRYKFTTSPEFKGFATEWRQSILPSYSGGQPRISPLTDKGRGVQLAVLEKTAPRVKLASVYQLKLKPQWKVGGVETVRGLVAPPVRTASRAAQLAMTATTVAVRGVARAAPKVIKGAVESKATTEVIASEAQKISAKASTKVAVETIIKKATVQAIELQATGMTVARIADMTELYIQDLVSTLAKPELRMELQVGTKLKAMTKVATKLATKIVTRLKTKISRLRIKILLPDGTTKTRYMTEKELAGSVAWKQGFIYALIYPPYGKDNIIHSRKPFPGVKTAKGARSAYKTVTKLGIKLPPSIKRDMGIMDIEFVTPKKGKGQPKITFAADIKQETWHIAGKRGKKRRFTNRKRTDRRERRLTASAIAG